MSQNRPSSIRVLLVDDHKILREGLRQLLDQEEGISVVATAGTAEEGLIKAESCGCHVALIDLSLPDRDGTWLLETLLRHTPDIKVIILSMHSDESTVLGALGLGASGYLTKAADQSEVVAAVRSVHAGGSYVQSSLASFLIANLRGLNRSEPPLEERELEILRRVSFGHSNQKIAEELFVSLSTVKAELRGLFRRLEASTRTELVMKAINRGLIDQSKPSVEKR